MVRLKSCQKKGRPRVLKSLIDRGTPELQHKRQALLKSLHTPHMSEQPPPIPFVHNDYKALFDGCYLHRLFYQGVLSQQHLQTGLSVRKLHYFCLRSRGIKNRLASSSVFWDGLRGKSLDPFESVRYEKKWYALKKSIEMLDNAPSYNQLILKIILNDSHQPNSYDIIVSSHGFLQSLRRSLDDLFYLVTRGASFL